MNFAHWHLVLNHFPILGMFFGVIFLAYSMYKKNDQMIVFAQLFFIFILLLTVMAYLTGDPAEEVLKSFPSIYEANRVDRHEDLALTGLMLTIVLGLLAAVNLKFFREEPKVYKTVVTIQLVFSFMIFIQLVVVGYTGGLIHHQELSSEPIPQKVMEKDTLPYILMLPSGEQKHSDLIKESDNKSMQSGFITLQANQNVGKHSTENNEEMIIVLSGSGEIVMDKAGKKKIEQGNVVYLPATTWHDVINTGNIPMKYIYVVSRNAK